MSDHELLDFDELLAERIDRGSLLRKAVAAGAGFGLAPYIATSRAFAASRTIKMGYVTPFALASGLR